MLAEVLIRVVVSIPDESDPTQLEVVIKKISFSDKSSEGVLPIADEDDITFYKTVKSKKSEVKNARRA